MGPHEAIGVTACEYQTRDVVGCKSRSTSVPEKLRSVDRTNYVTTGDSRDGSRQMVSER